MKKILVLLMILALFMSLFACTPDSQKDPNDPNDSQTNEDEYPPIENLPDGPISLPIIPAG